MRHRTYRRAIAAGFAVAGLLATAAPSNAGICTSCGTGAAGGGGFHMPGAPIIGPAQSGDAGGPITATATWAPPEDTKYIEYFISKYRVRATMVQPVFDTVTNTTKYVVLAAPVYAEYANDRRSTGFFYLPQAGNYIFDVQAITTGGDTAYSAGSNMVKGQ